MIIQKGEIWKKNQWKTTCDTKWTEPVENSLLERNEHNTAYIDFK